MQRGPQSNFRNEKQKRYEIRRIIILSAFIKRYDVIVWGSEHEIFTNERLVDLMAIKGKTTED